MEASDAGESVGEGKDPKRRQKHARRLLSHLSQERLVGLVLVGF
jgi:hypothetical protein